LLKRKIGLLLQRGLGQGVHSDYFRSYDFIMLAEKALSQQEVNAGNLYWLQMQDYLRLLDQRKKGKGHFA
jgi:hypothetical protein